MPPPMNIIVFVIWLFVHFINFVMEYGDPSGWNLYKHLDHRSFHRLRRYHFWHCESNTDPVRRGKTADLKTRPEIARWHFYGPCSGFKCLRKCCRRMKVVDSDTENTNYRIYHKSCHGELFVSSDTKKGRGLIFDKISRNYGITMREYFEKYERWRRMKVEAKDGRLLNQLTTTTLFCPHCYRPFLESVGEDESLKRRLLCTAYQSMLDYISAIMFVVIPVAWIPLIVLFAFLALKDWLLAVMNTDRDSGRQQSAADFDREYVPNRGRILGDAVDADEGA